MFFENTCDYYVQLTLRNNAFIIGKRSGLALKMTFQLLEYLIGIAFEIYFLELLEIVFT